MGVANEKGRGEEKSELELELELIQTQMAQKPMLRTEVYVVTRINHNERARVAP